MPQILHYFSGRIWLCLGLVDLEDPRLFDPIPMKEDGRFYYNFVCDFGYLSTILLEDTRYVSLSPIFFSYHPRIPLLTPYLNQKINESHYVYNFDFGAQKTKKSEQINLVLCF